MSSVYRASRRYWIGKEDGGKRPIPGPKHLRRPVNAGLPPGFARRTRSRQHAFCLEAASPIRLGSRNALPYQTLEQEDETRGK